MYPEDMNRQVRRLSLSTMNINFPVIASETVALTKSHDSGSTRTSFACWVNGKLRCIIYI